jgi:hypothetical protein
VIFICNGESRYHESRPIRISAGDNELWPKLGPIYLAYGIYFVNVTVPDDTGTNTILHWLHFRKIEIRGLVGYGPPHSVPLTLTLLAVGDESTVQENGQIFETART